MAEITITIPAAQLARVLHAMAVTLNVRDEGDALVETAPEVKAALRVWIKNSVRQVEQREAADTSASDFAATHVAPEIT